jgi:hypothetical protein
MYYTRRLLCPARAATTAVGANTFSSKWEGSTSLSPPLVLDAVRKDPGQTAVYYATRYFGGPQQASVLNFVLWSELKRFGQVLVERPDGPSGEARWVPMAFRPTMRTNVQRHNDDDVDLSVLSHAPPPPPPQASPASVDSSPPAGDTSLAPTDVNSASSAPLPDDPVEAIAIRLGPLILSIVGAFPGKDLPFYLRQITDEQDRSLAPVVFKQLRLSGKLLRARAEGHVGAFVWHVVPSPSSLWGSQTSTSSSSASWGS